MGWARILSGVLTALAIAYGAAVASYCSWPKPWRAWVRAVSDEHTGDNAVRILCIDDAAKPEHKHDDHKFD